MVSGAMLAPTPVTFMSESGLMPRSTTPAVFVAVEAITSP
jgi:hypothetical protein